MTKMDAPRAWRYFGTKRIQSSSPIPMTKMAASRTTRLRLSPKKSAARRQKLMVKGWTVSWQRGEACKSQIPKPKTQVNRKVGKSKKPEPRSRFGPLGFLVYLGFGCWDLGFPSLAADLLGIWFLRFGISAGRSKLRDRKS